MEFEFTSHKKEVLQALEDNMEVALEMIGLTAESYAKMNLTEMDAVDTGRLRNSVSHYANYDTDSTYIGTNVEYGPYIEFGTVKMAARPFLRRAVQEHVNEYKRLAENALRGK